MTAWTTRIGALVAILALAMAPAARAGCAARCAAPARTAPTSDTAADAAPAASHQHAHHHGPRADAMSAPGAGVRDTRCGPADGRGCIVIREAAAAPAGRELRDAVSLAVQATSAREVVPLAAPRQAHRTPPIRPPGPTAAPLPLRI